MADHDLASRIKNKARELGFPFWGTSDASPFEECIKNLEKRINHFPQSMRIPRHIAHRHWGIENDLFHTLVTYWSLDHCFKHHPMAILNFVLAPLHGFRAPAKFPLREC